MGRKWKYTDPYEKLTNMAHHLTQITFRSRDGDVGGRGRGGTETRLQELWSSPLWKYFGPSSCGQSLTPGQFIRAYHPRQSPSSDGFHISTDFQFLRI